MKKTVPVVFTKSVAATGTAPFATTAPRLFGLDVGDWSMILGGFALASLLLLIV